MLLSRMRSTEITTRAQYRTLVVHLVTIPIMKVYTGVHYYALCVSQQMKNIRRIKPDIVIRDNNIRDM